MNSMLEYMKQESNMTTTENGAAAYSSTGSECLDLFASAGALRKADADRIIRLVDRAYAESPDTAMKIIFYARDIRGGLGERRVFRAAMNRLAFAAPGSVKKNIGLIAEYGRWDDLLDLMLTPCEDEAAAALKARFDADMLALEEGGSVSLLGKWLPSINASSKETVWLARRMAGVFGLNNAEYRKALSALRARIHIIENDLREKDYSFDYEKQPSRALYKYKKAFIRNDGARYRTFIKSASEGKAKLHADNIAPYELVESYMNSDTYNRLRSRNCVITDAMLDEISAINATWDALPDFTTDDNALAVVDNSGSMYWTSSPKPASVALSLGLYLAEHNKGAFAGHFITFSRHPRLIELKGDTYTDRLRYAASFSECDNTDLEAVFELILSAAVKNGVPQSELPAKLVIISDMEFDACVRNPSATVFENAKKRYAERGYRLPQVVFWNAQSRHDNMPVKMNEQGVALVSGVTPRLFAMTAGRLSTPYELMMEIIGSERYAPVRA